MVSTNRKKLEADNSEKLAPIVKRHKTEFFEIFLQIISHLCTSLNHMNDEIMRDYIGERIFDLTVDFWEDCWENLDKLVEKVSFNPILPKIAYLHKMNA